MKDEYIRKQDAINALEEKEHEPWYLHKYLEWISGVVEAKDEIKSLEPADVALVVHSKWLYKCGEIQCPECGNRIHRIDLSGCLNFCPNCGAKMDGGKS